MRGRDVFVGACVWQDAFFGKARADSILWGRLLPTVYARSLLLLNLPGGMGSVRSVPPAC